MAKPLQLNSVAHPYSFVWLAVMAITSLFHATLLRLKLPFTIRQSNLGMAIQREKFKLEFIFTLPFFSHVCTFLLPFVSHVCTFLLWRFLLFFIVLSISFQPLFQSKLEKRNNRNCQMILFYWEIFARLSVHLMRK
ncbi:hypothetical protein J1N35_010508 [Gossypium stocksii]|uniref:Uncharacterized protein n=1 Tax=Gossypium stocksii TaxID=47602 RepID=A0A9D4ACM9_9ROSI|nr:hypothetical protein J1N35_010508 [Gossypium stocksii]